MTLADPDIDALAAIASLAEPIRRRLYELVASAGEPVSRDEAAAALGIGRPLAAFHLDRLVRAGLLEAEYRRRSGRSGPGAGRPAKLYSRARGTVQASLPPRRYELAATLFAEGLERAAGAGRSATLEAGRAFGQRAGAIAGERTGEADERLLEVLGELGFEPRADAAGRITLGSCPFDSLTAAHRGLTCGMNRALLEGLRDALGSARRVEEVDRPGACCVAFGPADAAVVGVAEAAPRPTSRP